MDGMHRAAKALMLGIATLLAKQFIGNPKPDYIGIKPDALAY